MKVFNYLVLSIFTVLLIFSCGNKEEKKNGFSYENKSDASQQSTDSNPNDVVLTSNDAMQFNKKEIKVVASEKVKITLKHIGKMDKNVMGHNFVLLKQGVNVIAFSNKAAGSRSNDYIPEGTQDIIVHTKMLSGGETDIIEFDAPLAGTYDFLCSFPGHSGLMKGKFIVE